MSKYSGLREVYYQSISQRLEELKDDKAFISLVIEAIRFNHLFSDWVINCSEHDLKNHLSHYMNMFQYMADLGHGLANCLDSNPPV